jgi:CheY-like chemotaxis protein
VLVQQIQGAVLAVEAHARPEDALARLRAAARAGEPFDLLLLDLGLGARDGLDVLRELRAAPELASLRVVVLTGQLQRRSEAFDHGAHAVLGKPARRRQLLATLGRLVGDGAVAPGGRESHEPQARLDARVLLADDNPVNQRVAARLLERMGCEVELAGDGAQAVELALREEFDVILMDCQMPSLDGYMATRAIREREGRGGRHRTIIAMTANAMAGDREKCLDAGMDDYVTKPIRGEILRATLERWLARRARR